MATAEVLTTIIRRNRPGTKAAVRYSYCYYKKILGVSFVCQSYYWGINFVSFTDKKHVQ